MARICAFCRQPVVPVNECICDDEPEPEPSSGEEAEAA